MTLVERTRSGQEQAQPRTQGLISAPRHAPAPLRKYPDTG